MSDPLAALEELAAEWERAVARGFQRAAVCRPTEAAHFRTAAEVNGYRALDLRAAIAKTREALGEVEPCNRCGQSLVINPKPLEDIVVCEQCAFGEGKDHVLAHLASEQVVDAVVERLGPYYGRHLGTRLAKMMLAALRWVLGGEGA